MRVLFHRRSLLLFSAAICSTAPAFAGGVRIVERPDIPAFTSIQGAVDAALDGETVLVGEGAYGPFTMSARSVSVLGEGTGLVTVNGTVTVMDLPSTGTVLLVGLTINGTNTIGTGAYPGLRLTSNAGHVRVQGCAIQGGLDSDPDQPQAGSGVEIVNCPKVAFVSCTVTGRSHVGYCAGCSGAPGGNGIFASNGGVSLYDCTVKGGGGTNESYPGGDGGHGYHASGWGVVASGSTILGGPGGGADYVACSSSGSGGHGIFLNSAQAHLLDNAISGGPAGIYSPCGQYGAPGQPIHNQSSFVDLLAGTKRKLSALAFASDHTPLAATVSGEAGDKVYVFVARGPYFLFLQAFNGTWLVPYYGFLAKAPLTVLPTSGPASLSIPLPNLQPPEVAEQLFVQALATDVTGRKCLSSPQHVLLLNRDALPDCNGNGVLDFIDTIEGLGTVPDVNDDFIPDVCGGAEYWVDASAPPGGNGSVLSPFQNIRAGIDASPTGYTVIVRDGVYLGASNRNLDFGGRDMVVKSENGPASCVIDCQGSGRAFLVHTPATVAARIEGFTIRNGAASGGAGGFYGGAGIHADAVSVWDCVIENCVTNVYGGGIEAARVDVRRCVFRANSGGTYSWNSGGAIDLWKPFVYPPPPPSVIQECSFEGNQASLGGALFAGGIAGAIVSHCTFLANTGSEGGAIYDELHPAVSLRIDDCVFAGNSASLRGGAVAARLLDSVSPAIQLTGSTFTANTCTGGYGGALSFQDQSVASLANCILWGDSASQGGSEISLREGYPKATVSWCDVQGGTAAIDWSAGVLTWGAGNLDLDPQFSDPDGPDNDPLTYFDNDYTLSLASPCIDAADNASIPADLTDIDGDGDTTEPVPLDLLLGARRIDVPSVPDTGSGSPPIVDMGPFERP